MPEISYEMLEQIIEKLNETSDEGPIGAEWASDELLALRAELERIRDAEKEVLGVALEPADKEQPFWCLLEGPRK